MDASHVLYTKYTREDIYHHARKAYYLLQPISDKVNENERQIAVTDNFMACFMRLGSKRTPGYPLRVNTDSDTKNLEELPVFVDLDCQFSEPV